MVRYPKSIAYGFKIDPELENMKIPKFTLQTAGRKLFRAWCWPQTDR